MEILLRKNRLPLIKTRRLVLRDIRLEDISREYIHWLNDGEIVKYLEIRFTKQTPEKIREYVKSKLMDTVNTKHFGVYDECGKRLVGTVTLPRINWNHAASDISFVIGHPEARGKGYATEAVHSVCYHMFEQAGLKKLWGGYYDGHRASAKVFKNNGFEIEGRLKKKLVAPDKKRVDLVLVGLLAEDFKPAKKFLGPLPPKVFGSIKEYMG
jgi:RimJ/RimL family protein N-acetyltransferase